MELGNKSLFPWLSQEHGTIIDVIETHTICSLTSKSVKEDE